MNLNNLIFNFYRPSTEKSVKVFLVVLVITGPKFQKQRDAMRTTWLSNKTSDVVHYFSIGTEGLTEEELATLNKENFLNQDLLLLPDLKDSYKDLTEKLLHSLKWLDRHVDYTFLFKVDDDTFARLDIITWELRRTRETNDLYWGFFTGRARVKRRGKWAEPGWVLCDNYLPYARGGGYLLSANLANFVARNSDFLKRFNSEDVSMGAWLGGVKVNRVHDPRFDTEYRSRGCHNKYIVTHKQDIASLMEKHRNLQHSGKLCDKEYRLMTSYIYNWDVPPSQCCVRNNTNIP